MQQMQARLSAIYSNHLRILPPLHWRGSCHRGISDTHASHYPPLSPPKTPSPLPLSWPPRCPPPPDHLWHAAPCPHLGELDVSPLLVSDGTQLLDAALDLRQVVHHLRELLRVPPGAQVQPERRLGRLEARAQAGTQLGDGAALHGVCVSLQ